MKKFFEEFKTFISKGNVIDLAVAVVIGNAFNAIVSSLVNDIIMPLVGLIIGGIDFSDIKLTLGEASIMFGKFIQNVVDFLIVALTIFVVVKAFNKLQEKTKKKEDKKEEAPKKADDVILLEEIRDLLKKQK
ncbi:MAG: large-conductance mechanosensitive channel protein MscL [Bacilli bacterium]|nr:large-conductance mechanosensitive channel protein MscL [Bacilli bacterium]